MSYLDQDEDFEHDLLQVIAHDLKTPISAAKSFIELIEQAGPLNEQQQTFSARAVDVLLRMERFISDMIELSNIEEQSGKIKMSRCALRPLVDDALLMLENVIEARRITVHIFIAPDAETLIGDERLLRQVFTNLLSNAVKYNRDQGEIWVLARREHAMVRVEVRDTGRGISEQDQERVFARFFRVKDDGYERVSGTGLGLAIVDLVVKRHNGRVTLESKLGEGTTFRLLLPGPPPDSFQAFSHEMPPFAGERADGMDDLMQDPPEILDTDSGDEQF